LQVNDYILTYEQAYKIGLDQVGAKAFNIAACNDAGFRVPDGVIISVQAFRAYLNGDKLETLFSYIEDYITNTRSIIVRSSALEEDTAKVSFAGQYLSVICLNNATEIKKACEACWASYFSSNVEAYHGAIKGSTTINKNGMGLLIQRIVNATSAGVCFTKDPLKDKKDVFIINAVHGQGEALMAGEVVADQYTFDVNFEKVVSQYTGNQSLWRSSESPRKLTALPLELQNKPALSSIQIKGIAQIARKAVKLFGSPQDIEWAYEGNKLFLLQARPITKTIKNVGYELWTRDNVADVIPDAVTPLTWSIVEEATNNGFKKVIQGLGLSNVSTILFNVFDSRVYLNQTTYQGLLNIKPKKIYIPYFFLKVALSYLRLLFSLKKDVPRLEDTFWEGLNTLSVPNGASAIMELKNYLDKYMAIHIRIAVLMDLGFLFIRRLIKRYIPEDEANAIVDGLVTGLNEIESTASGEALWELACLIKEDKKLADTIQNSSVQLVPNILKTWGGIYGEKWQQFLDRYGHSSLKEFELYYPRWSEDPSFIVTILKQYIIESGNLDLETNKRICTGKRMESKKTLLKGVPFMYHPPLKFYIKHVRQCSIWRESLKQKIVRIMAEIRKQALAFADENAITPLEDVFFLTVEEISKIKDNSIPPQLFEEIATRRQNWEKWRKQEPFKEIRVFANGRQMKVPYFTGIGDKLKGLGLSSGKYTGPAKVILDPTHMDSFNLGDVLVARSTNPSWTPLFTLAGAIVTDMGNYLSHGAIIARELGIPAVGNIFDATKRITNGQVISVDGDNGIVYLNLGKNI
jgi:pyruvate,water dikinase